MSNNFDTNLSIERENQEIESNHKGFISITPFLNEEYNENHIDSCLQMYHITNHVNSIINQQPVIQSSMNNYSEVTDSSTKHTQRHIYLKNNMSGHCSKDIREKIKNDLLPSGSPGM